MSQDPESAGSAGRERTEPAGGDGTRSSVGRLPPPAFPPDATRRQHEIRDRDAGLGEGLAPYEQVADSDLPEDAFILPDEPIPWLPEVPAGAFIDPDEPIVRQEGEPDRIGPEEAVVTGLGDDAHLDRGELAAAGDPYVLDLVEKVAKLAEALRRRGEAGLRTERGMSPFEATLRAYCVGYLAGRRAEDDPA